MCSGCLNVGGAEVEVGGHFFLHDQGDEVYSTLDLPLRVEGSYAEAGRRPSHPEVAAGQGASSIKL